MRRFWTLLPAAATGAGGAAGAAALCKLGSRTRCAGLRKAAAVEHTRRRVRIVGTWQRQLVSSGHCSCANAAVCKESQASAALVPTQRVEMQVAPNCEQV